MINTNRTLGYGYSSTYILESNAVNNTSLANEQNAINSVINVNSLFDDNKEISLDISTYGPILVTENNSDVHLVKGKNTPLSNSGAFSFNAFNNKTSDATKTNNGLPFDATYDTFEDNEQILISCAVSSLTLKNYCTTHYSNNNDLYLTLQDIVSSGALRANVKIQNKGNFNVYDILVTTIDDNLPVNTIGINAAILLSSGNNDIRVFTWKGNQEREITNSGDFAFKHTGYKDGFIKTYTGNIINDSKKFNVFNNALYSEYKYKSSLASGQLTCRVKFYIPESAKSIEKVADIEQEEIFNAGSNQTYTTDSNVTQFTNNSSIKIVIDVGHTPTTGAAANGTNEHEISTPVSIQLKNLLEKNGRQVQIIDFPSMTDNGSEFRKVVSESNKIKPDIFISLHCDAGSSSARGAHTIYGTGTQYQANSKLLAESISNYLCPFMPGRANKVIGRPGPSGGSLYVLNKTNSTAVLIEQGFVTNKSDVVKMQNYNKIAELIYQGVEEYISKTYS